MIITIHVLGQVGLHFKVSVPQILAAILTTAIIEIVLTFRQTRSFVWPASAMLTGSGVALILRVVGTPPDDPWNTDAWYIFAVVAGLSLLTKYVIRYRGSHVFNPSNIGLVVAFVVLGSTVVEPLDFWWAPLNVWMITAYVVIIGGGLLITRRLHLLALAATFWVSLTIGVGLLAGSGHCMTANWAFEPVCGFDFWRVIVTSPEVLIFLFFMITDPKTTPAGRVGRVDVRLPRRRGQHPAAGSADQRVRHEGRAALGPGAGVRGSSDPRPARAGAAIHGRRDRPVRAAARDGRPRRGRCPARRRAGRTGRGGCARGRESASSPPGRPRAGPSSRPRTRSSTGCHSTWTRGPSRPSTSSRTSSDFDPEMLGPKAQGLVLTLAENLELENQALLRRDESILVAVDHGDRLIEMQGRLRDAVASGMTTVRHYQIDDIRLSLLIPFGKQTGLSMGLDSKGTVVEETYDAAGTLKARTEAPFAQTFVMRRATGARWLNVAVLPPGAGT